MGDKLNIIGTWKLKKNFLGVKTGFIKDDLFMFPLLTPSGTRTLLVLKIPEKIEDYKPILLGTVEKGSYPNRDVWHFHFDKADYELEYYKDKGEIKISKKGG